MTAAMDRRHFIRGAASVGAATVALGACRSGGDDGGAGSDTGIGEITVAPRPALVPFHGPHQTGIQRSPGSSGIAAAFVVTATNRDELADALQALTAESRSMMAGAGYDDRSVLYPALHAGTLGDRVPASNLSITVSVSASLFDERFGLADRRPRELVSMPYGLGNDRLDASRTHGDLLITISSDSPDVSIFALRQLMRRTRGGLALAWMLDGFNRSIGERPGRASVRNLMGFLDGTANLARSDEELMDRFVWVGAGDGEPAWATGGTYHVVRAIRMFVEFWDRATLAEQEAIIGRHKATGAPLGRTAEDDAVSFTGDPRGSVTALGAHIRLANPRTPESDANHILRHGFSYSRGFDRAGRLDQGLLFMSFQRSLERGFLAVQSRLKGEALEEYIQPEGGGFFFALPGVTDQSDWYGRTLLA